MFGMYLLVLTVVSVCYWSYAVQDHCTECCQYSLSDCQDYRDLGHNASGIYHVTPIGTFSGFDVFCDMVKDGGGWLVFQRRSDGSVNFNRSWESYELGFGDPRHEHWIGLLQLKRILSQGHYELRIDIEDWGGKTRYAQYNHFDIGGHEKNYSLKAYSYAGTAGDGFKDIRKQKFSTKEHDRDNDNTSKHCAKYQGGGWWYNQKCDDSNLNGKKLRWNPREKSDTIKSSEMKIRRA